MKTTFSKIYKKLLVIWIAIGLSVSGYFYIYPIEHRVLAVSRMDKSYEQSFGPRYEDGKHFEVSLLVTLVGSILIGGLGFATKSKE